MSIDFPPPPTPTLGDAASLLADAGQGAVTVDVAGYRLHVHAPGVLSADEIIAVTAGLGDVSNAVRALALAAQRKGVLLPKTLYVRRGDEVYVSIYAGKVNSVKAPGPLAPYFSGLVEQDPLTIAAFEKRRLLASIHASRMGESFTPVFEPAEGNGYGLTLKPAAEGVNPGALRINLSNAGNRFTGREFVDFDARRGDVYGNEYSVFARTATQVLNLDGVEPGSDYHEYQLGWSRVVPIGLFSASARYLDYRQHFGDFTFNGELWTVDVGYTGILFASTTQRITTQLKADYIHKELLFDRDGQRLQKEPYPSLEAGLAWSTSFRLLGQSWLSLAGLSARQGIGADSIAQSRADLDYWLLRPSYSLRSQGGAFNAELLLAAQYAGVTVPEQQQWIIGGVGNLHAYVPGVAVGDRGLLARLVGEYRGFSAYGVSVSPRLFVEFAASETAERFADRPDTGTQLLTDLGAEVVLGFAPWFEASLISALPVQHSHVSKAVRDDARADFFFRLTAKF